MRLFRDLVDWFYAQAPGHRPEDADPDKARPLEELMRELSIFEINERRMIARHRREAKAETLVRLAEHRFGTDIGRRLANSLGSESDPAVFERAGDLILDCDDGEQLLNGINGTPRGA